MRIYKAPIPKENYAQEEKQFYLTSHINFLPIVLQIWGAIIFDIAITSIMLIWSIGSATFVLDTRTVCLSFWDLDYTIMCILRDFRASRWPKSKSYFFCTVLSLVLFDICFKSNSANLYYILHYLSSIVFIPWRWLIKETLSYLPIHAV